MIFYTGVHQLSLIKFVDKAFISVNILRKGNRKSFFEVSDWIMDSGAFTEISNYGNFRFTVDEYAGWINKFKDCGNLELAVSQDYMCEPFILNKTGLSIQDHQRLTINRYDDLVKMSRVKIMPVLQGYKPEDYVSHIKQYGNRLKKEMRVGVGSVCKRNSKPSSIIEVLTLIKSERPDLRLHGFGVKVTSLSDPQVSSLLYSSDSMAWSYAARREGRDANSGYEARAYTDKVYKILNGELAESG